MRVADFVLEKKRVESYPDFENLAHVMKHGLERLKVKLKLKLSSKVSQRRQTILVIAVL